MKDTMMTVTRTVNLSAPYPFTSHAHATLVHTTNAVKETQQQKTQNDNKKERKEEKKRLTEI